MGMNDMIHFFRQKLGLNIYAGIPDQTNPQQISFLRQLQKEMKEKTSLNSLLKDLKVVVFDLETTGFYPDKGDQVISIGAIKMIGARVIEEETFYSLVKYDLPLPKDVAMLTNIQEEQLRTAPPASEVLIQFLQYANKNILVAHHANHEKAFMQKLTWDILKARFEQRIIDTSFLISLLNLSTKALPLEEACSECGIEVKDRHNALGDAKMTAHLWSYYLLKAQEMGFTHLIDVYEYLAKWK